MAALSSAAQRQELMKPGTGTVNIKDDLAHESLKGVLVGVSNLKEGKVGEIIRKFSGADPRWVWTVEEGYVPGQANAHTKPAQNGVVTTLNYSRLKGATRLSVARTLIHEMIHAYLVLSFRYDTAAAKKYPRIEAAYKGVVPAPELNEVHHREMAQSFVGVIASALREYGRSLGLTVNDSVYTDLAWGGLDFQHNEELAEENKLRIHRRLKAEQFDTPIFPDVRPVGQQMGD
jgi:hypothetical protein